MLPHLTLGFPEPEVTWFKNASTIREDQGVRITQDNGTHTLLVEQATKDDSGQYAIQVKNDKGREIRSFVVNVGPDDEKTAVREVVTVHEVSEKSEALEGSVDEFDVSVSLEAKEGRKADLREKLEGTEKLIVVDTKVQIEDETDKTKEQKKKEVTVKKEVVTVHKVEEQVIADGQVVREIRETVSSSELESGADVGLTEDSLHKLEPFVMMENRIQKPKKGDVESDEEVEEIIEVKKEVRVLRQVQERYGGQGENLEVTGEMLSTSEAKEVLESGVKIEKLEEVEKLIVIDNESIVIQDADTSKKKKQHIQPKENDDSSVEVSTEITFAESDVKTKQRPEIAVEETVTVSEITGKQKGIIPVQESDEILALAPKMQPKKPWLESESESETESDVESDEPQKKVKSGDVISNVVEDMQQKMKKVEEQRQKKPSEESETESDMEFDEDTRSGRMKQKPKEMHPEELQTTEKKPKEKIKGKRVLCVEGSEEAISMEEEKKAKFLASSEEIEETKGIHLKERKEKGIFSADDIEETTDIEMKKIKKEEYQEKPVEKRPKTQEEPGSLEELETGSSEEESYGEEEEEKEAAVTEVLIEQKKVKAKKEEVTVKEETARQKTENIEDTVEQVQEQVMEAKVVTDETKTAKKQKKGEIIQTLEMSEEVLEATVQEKRKARLLASAEETEETTELSLEEKKQRGPITSEESEEMIEMKMKKKKPKPQEEEPREILPEEEEPLIKKPKEKKLEKKGEMVTSSEVSEETIEDSKRKTKLVATTDETEETTELTLDEKKKRGIITAEDSEDTVELTMKRKPKASLEPEIKHEKDDEQIKTDEEQITEMSKPKKPWEVSDSETGDEFESGSEIKETRKEIIDVISVQSRQDDKSSEYIATPEGLVQPQVEVVTETAPDSRASQEAPNFKLVPKPVSMVEGKTVKLTCRVKG